jgi:MFS family permease
MAMLVGARALQGIGGGAITVTATALIGEVIPLRDRGRPTLAVRGRPIIDYTGILFVGLGATGLTLATSWGGTTYPWNSATIIGLFVGSTAALGIFVWIESRVAAPILPTRLFGSPVFTVCCVLSFVVGFAMLGALTFLPTYMQFVDGVSATTSGLRTLPMVAECSPRRWAAASWSAERADTRSSRLPERR